MQGNNLLIDHTSKDAIEYTKYNIIQIERNTTPALISAGRRTATHMLYLKAFNEIVAIQVCESLPARHTWVKVNLADSEGRLKPVYLRANNLAEKLGISLSVAQASDFVKVLSGLTQLMHGRPDSSHLNHTIPPPPTNAPPPPPLSFGAMVQKISQFRDARLITSLDFDKAKAYVRANEAFLKQQLGNDDYVMIPKESSSLPFNLEYHKDGVAFCRYHPNYTHGQYKEVSRHIDLRGYLMVKSKMVLREDDKIDEAQTLKDANEYRAARLSKKGEWHQPGTYRTQPVRRNRVEAEVKVSLGVESALAIWRIVFYTKTAYSPKGKLVQVHKVAIYTLQQEGSIKDAELLTEKLKKKLSKRLIQNVDSLHKQGYCHNDVKGENFVYSAQGDNVDTKFIDLDFITRIYEFHAPRAGTLCYMPLERFNDYEVYAKYWKEKSPLPGDLTFIQINTAKDNFGLGVTLLELYGYKSWCRRAEFLVEQLKSTQSLDLSFMPVEMRPVVLGFLHPDLKQRMETQEALRLLN